MKRLAEILCAILLCAWVVGEYRLELPWRVLTNLGGMAAVAYATWRVILPGMRLERREHDCTALFAVQLLREGKVGELRRCFEDYLAAAEPVDCLHRKKFTLSDSMADELAKIARSKKGGGAHG